jgi:hypothetical protein
MDGYYHIWNYNFRGRSNLLNCCWGDCDCLEKFGLAAMTIVSESIGQANAVRISLSQDLGSALASRAWLDLYRTAKASLKHPQRTGYGRKLKMGIFLLVTLPLNHSRYCGLQYIIPRGVC